MYFFVEIEMNLLIIHICVDYSKHLQYYIYLHNNLNLLTYSWKQYL